MIDTLSKRLSLIAFGIVGLTIPSPDGALSKGDRQHLLGIPSSSVVVEDFDDPATETVTRQILYAANGEALRTTGAGYMDLFTANISSASEAEVQVPAGASGVLRNWAITLTTAPGVGKSYSFTVRVNGVATALAITIADNETTGRYTGSDLAITAAQLISVRYVANGTPTAGEPFNWTVEFEGDDANTSIYGGSLGGGNLATWYAGAFNPGPVTAGFNFGRQSLAAVAGNLTALRIRTTATGTYHYYIYKNGVRQDGSGGTVNTQVITSAVGTVSATFTLAIVAGDRVSVEAERQSVGAGHWSCAVAFVATTAGQFHICGGFPTSANLPTADTRYQAPVLRADTSWNTTENSRIRDLAASITTVTLSNFRVLPEGSPSPGTWTFTTRENEADSTITATVSSAAEASDTTHSLELVDGDRWSLKCVPASSPATGQDAIWCWRGAAALTTSDPIPPSTNPAPGDPVGSLHFAQIVIDGVSKFAAESIIRDPAANWGGKKVASLLNISRVSRELAQDYRASTFSITVSDTDNLWRGRTATETLEGCYVAVYRCEAPNGIIEGTPFRLMAGRVKPGGFRAEEGSKFTLECVDVLGDFFSDPANQPVMPSKRITLAEFAGMDPDFDGRVAPRALGLLVEDGVGVVPGVYMGQVNPSIDFNAAGVNALYHVLLLSEGVVYDIPLLYINILTWSAGQTIYAGNYIRPTPDNASAGAGYLFKATVGGTTGGTEPTWPTTGTVADNTITWEVVGLDDPTLRIPIPASAYTGGTDFTHARASNWGTVTGLSDPYVDWIDGRRYTIALLKSDHYYAEALADGRVQPLFDIIGATTDAAGDGPPLLDPGYLYTWLLCQYVFADNDGTTDVTLPTLPGLDGETAYSVVDTDTADAAKAIADAEGGYRMGFLLGASGEPDDVWDVLGRLLKGGGLQIGQNRHGQLIFSRRDHTASSVITLTPQRDYTSSRYWVESQDRGTRIEYRYGKRYADPFAPESTPSPGQPLVAIGGRPKFGEWASGLQRLIATAAETALATTGRAITKRLIEQENDVTRDDNTAYQVAYRLLDYGTGPNPGYNGTPMFELQGSMQRLLMAEDSNGSTRELGDVIGITDVQGLSVVGYTAKKGRITKIELDPERDWCVLTGEILDPEVLVVA